MSDQSSWHGFSYEPGPIDVKGAVFVDFQLTDHLPQDQVAGVIERDRVVMATQPGMNRKLLPLAIDPETGNAYSGGRYLFDTLDNARKYAHWVESEFELDGTLFFNRPDFTEINAQYWRVIGAHDFKPVTTSQRVFRTERWNAGSATEAALQEYWAALVESASAQDLASLWLAYSAENQQVTLLTVIDTAHGADDQPDFGSLAALASSPSLGQDLEHRYGMEKVFDRTSWAFTIWFPYAPGKDNMDAPWPNSPPLPSPAAPAEENAA